MNNRAHNFCDLTGQKFHKLTVLKMNGKNKEILWLCKCDCGKTTTVRANNLKSGQVKSCGCLQRTSESDYDKYIGKKFNRLTVLKYLKKDSHSAVIFSFLCDCGNYYTGKLSPVKSGKVKSCGCYGIEQRKNTPRNLRHGHNKKGRTTPTYHSWASAKKRCFNKNDSQYKNYGGRGIMMCQRWRNSFEAFLKDMGEKQKGLSIDRIDNDGHYSCGKCSQCRENNWPMNCKYTTDQTQARNRRNNRVVKINDKEILLLEVINNSQLNIHNLSYTCIHKRLSRGWSIEKSLSTPFQEQYRRQH